MDTMLKCDFANVHDSFYLTIKQPPQSHIYLLYRDIGVYIENVHPRKPQLQLVLMQYMRAAWLSFVRLARLMRPQNAAQLPESKQTKRWCPSRASQLHRLYKTPLSLSLSPSTRHKPNSACPKCITWHGMALYYARELCIFTRTLARTQHTAPITHCNVDCCGSGTKQRVCVDGVNKHFFSH